MFRFLLFAVMVFFLSSAPAAAAQETPDVPGLDLSAPRADATITPLDRIQVNVFREPEMSADDVLVDESGRILLPLVGGLSAAGKSTELLAAEIAERLRRYIRDPQVSVRITQTASRRVTVTGSVMEPGVYPMDGRTTLLQAIALAKGPSQVAKLNQTIVFRTENGKRTAARFDLDEIARGNHPDPEVLPGDTIAIGSSKFKTGWRDFVATMRSFNIFSVVP